MRELTFTEAAREGLSEEMAETRASSSSAKGSGRGRQLQHHHRALRATRGGAIARAPITERGFTGLCTGAAMTGARPVVDYMFFDFALDALGELLNQTSKIQYMSDGRLRMPIVLRGCVGVGPLGGHPPLRQLLPDLHEHPGVPRRGPDHAGRRQGAPEDGDPVRRPRHGAPVAEPEEPVPDGEHLVPFGRAAIARAGSDVTVVGIAVMVQRAWPLPTCWPGGRLRRGHRPADAGPLDLDTILESVHKTGRLLIADESWPCAGRRRDRRPGGGPRLRRPRCPHPAAQRAPHILQPTREGCGAGRGRRRPRHSGPPCRVARALGGAPGPRRRRVARPGVRRPARPERPAGHAGRHGEPSAVCRERARSGSVGRDARRPGRAAPAPALGRPLRRSRRSAAGRGDPVRDEGATSSEAGGPRSAAWPRAATASLGRRPSERDGQGRRRPHSAPSGWWGR